MTIKVLAKKMMLTAEQAVALPQVITSAAIKSNMSEQQLIHACFDNGAVRDYLASVCRTVAK